MKVINLPEGVVSLLNCLYHRDSVTECWEDYSLDRQGAQIWLQRESAFHCNEDEAREFENLSFLWREIDAIVEGDMKDLGNLSAMFFEAASLMEKIEKRRDRATYSPQPIINRLLLVGAAFLNQRTSADTLDEYLNLAADYHSYITHMYTAWKLEIPGEMTGPIEDGFEHMKVGLETAQASLDCDPGQLEQGLALVKAGSELVQFLINRLQAQDRLAKEEHQSLKIPFFGPELECQLKAARESERSLWGPAVRETLEATLPSLRLHSEQWLRSALIDQTLMEHLGEELEDALDSLQDVFENALNPDYSAEEVTECMASALHHLSDCYLALEQAALKTEGVEGTVDGLYVQLCSGVMSAVVPDLALANLLQEHLPSAGLGHFQAYLQDGVNSHLVEGLRLMLAARPAPLEMTPCFSLTG